MAFSNFVILQVSLVILRSRSQHPPMDSLFFLFVAILIYFSRGIFAISARNGSIDFPLWFTQVISLVIV